MSKRMHLSAAILLALCVGLLVGAAWATDSWDPTAETIPSALVWDQTAAVSVDAENNGSLTPPPPATWDTTYSIESVEGSGAGASQIDRWGVTSVPVAGPVPPTDPDLAGMYTWDFTITAPPIATLAYTLPIGPTSVATAAALDCNWMFAKSSVLFTDLPTVENPITVTRFPDIAPGAAGAWAATQVQECAGRVPMIVGGYGDGTYRPSLTVTRDQMAVFMQRAMELLLASNDGHFVDVPIGYWAGDQIQSCVDAGIVGGFDPTHYGPTMVVNRDAMAVFVARGMAGGESNVPAGPGTATFSDVPVGYWAYDHVEYAVAHSVVGGYGDGTYRPTLSVTRDQMAVFVYRAAIQPSGAVVVLAGPGITGVDLGSAGYDGWSTASIGEAAGPGTAYVAFDAVKAPSADIDVTFELRDATTPTTPATGDYLYSTSVLASDLAIKKASAALDGNPYIYAPWPIPAGLTPGDYLLVTTVNGVELSRKPAFEIGTPPDPPTAEEVVLHPTSVSTRNGTLTSGVVANLAADDGSYMVWTAGATGLVGERYVFATTLTPADILKVKVEITFKGSDPDVVPISLMTSGATGGTRYCDTADTIPLADTTFAWESANTSKIADMLQAAGTFDVIFCSCDDTPGYTFDLSVDEVKVTFTLK